MDTEKQDYSYTEDEPVKMAQRRQNAYIPAVLTGGGGGEGGFGGGRGDDVATGLESMTSSDNSWGAVWRQKAKYRCKWKERLDFWRAHSAEFFRL